MVTVMVCSKSSGRPVDGRRVSIGFDGWLRGVTNDRYTDSNGEVHFDADPGTGTVYVDGTSVYEGRIEGRIVVYV